MSIVIGLGNSDEQPKWQDPLGLYGGKAPDFSTQAQPAQQSAAPAASWADNERDQNDIINTVIGEAAGEGDQGMAAVASVIRNRAAARGLSPADVVRQPDQFTAYAHPGSAVRKEMTDPALRERATSIVNSIFDGSTPDPTGGADHYHATSVSPSWAQSMPETTRVGNHIFYRSGKAAAPAREKTNAIAYNGEFKDSLGLYGGNDPFAAVMNTGQQPAPADDQQTAAKPMPSYDQLKSEQQPADTTAPDGPDQVPNPKASGFARLVPPDPEFPAGEGGKLNFVHAGQNKLTPVFESVLTTTSRQVGRDLTVTSGYRSPTHPVEAAKAEPGEHSKHEAADVSMAGMDDDQRSNLVQAFIANGAKRFITYSHEPDMLHVDMKDQRGDGSPYFMFDKTAAQMSRAPKWFQAIAAKPAPNAQPVTSDSTEMRPFKPGETRPNADGSYSTEISTTWQLPDGKWVNVPSLWMGPKGPVQFKADDEQSILGNMQQYEAQHGQTFQRFDTEQQAVTAAKERSAAGGAGAGPQTAGGIAVDRNWKPSDPMNMYPDGNPIQQAAQSQFAKQDADEASAAAQAEQNRMRGIAEQQNAAVGDQLEELNKDNPGRYQAVDQSQVGDWQKKWNDENKSTGVLGDTKRMLVKGTAGFLQDLDSLADTVFPHIPGGKQFLEASDKIDTWLIGKPLADRMQDVSEKSDASVTDRQKEADAKNWWDSKNGRLGPAWSDPRSYLRVTAESAPSTAITMLPGGIMARGVFIRGVAAGLTEREAAAAAAKTAAIAGGITEGLQAGGNSARSVRDRIAEIPREQLVQSEAVQQLVKGGLSEDDAVKAVTEDAATQAMLVTGVATGIFGGQGDKVLAKIIGEGISGNIAKRVAAGAAKGFVGEGVLEELPQNVAQQVSENAAVKRVDPKQDLTEGVGEAVASGIAGGGAMGAGMGGAGGAVSRAHGHEAVQEHDAEATTPAPAEPAAAPETAAAGPIGRAVKHASEQATRRNEPKFVVDDAAIGSQPPGPLNGQTVTVAPDQSGVPANMRRVITSDGTESTIGNGLLKPADKPTPAKPPVPDGAPEIGATVQVDHEGVEPFMASVDGYEGDEAILIDRGSGEVYQVPISSISQIAPSPETAQRNAEAAQRAVSGQPTPESDPALEPVAPKAAEVKTEPLPPRSEQKPATEAMPRAPGPGESIIVDNQRAGRFVGKVKSWENGGTEALVTDPDGNDFQVPVSDLYVNKLTEKQVEDQELKRNPPVEREIADAGPNSRKVFGKTVVLPDDLHARLYDLGKERFVSKKAGGNSQLDLGRVNSPELTKLATDFGISPTDLGSMADDYRYRVDRSAKEARTTLPINMAQVNERRLKQWQSKNAKTAALPDDLGNWWDVQLTEPQRKAALAKAGVQRSEKVMWGGFTPNLQKKLAAVREETIREKAVVSDTTVANPDTEGQIADTAPAKTDSAAQAELSTQNPDVTIEQRDNDILLKRTDGAAHLSVKPVGKDLKIGIASASKAIRGQGKTRALYEEAIRLAGERGGVLRSDMVVSHDATHVYDALKRRGYEVERNPKAENGHRGLISPSAAPDNWVFKVKPKPTEAEVSGETTSGRDARIEAIHREMASRVSPKDFVNDSALRRNREDAAVIDPKGKLWVLKATTNPSGDHAEFFDRLYAEDLISPELASTSNSGYVRVTAYGKQIGAAADAPLTDAQSSTLRALKAASDRSAITFLGQTGEQPVEEKANGNQEAGGLSTDTAAHEAATSPQNDLPQPSQAQKEAGNYQKGHIRLGGLDISIENPAGSERSGTDASGKPWSVEMKSHYGYIRGTVGKDKDHIDVFVKPGTEQLDDDAPVFVVDQATRTGSDVFDEHKVMLGFDTTEDARTGYLANYAKGWKGIGNISETTLGKFKRWLSEGDTTKPFAQQQTADQSLSRDDIVAGQTDQATGKPVSQRATSPTQANPDFPRISEMKDIAFGPGARIKPRAIAEGRALYREMDVNSLNGLLREDDHPDIANFFVADNPDLAIGQGINKGVKVTFRPDSLGGGVHNKPGTSDITGREYLVDMITPRAMASITMPAKDVNRLTVSARRRLTKEFTRENLPKGIVRFDRTGLDQSDAPRKRPDPKKLNGRTSNDLVELVPPARPEGQPIKDWAVNHLRHIGEKTGHEYILAVDDDGSVVTYGTAGHRGETGLNDKLFSAMANPDRQLVVFHNHPNSSSVSVTDIAMLAMPGIHSVWAIGHNGNDFRIALTTDARARALELAGENLADSPKSVSNLQQALNDRLMPIAKHLVAEENVGRITPSQANEAWNLIPAMVAERAGIIDFQTPLSYDPTAISGLDQKIDDAAGSIARGFFNDDRQVRSDARLRGPSESVGHIAELEAMGEGGQPLAGRRPTARGLSEGSSRDHRRQDGEGREIADDQVLRSVSERDIISKVRQNLDGKSTDIQPLLLKTVPLNYFPELAGDKIPAIADYLHVKRSMDAYRGRKHDASVKIIDQWRKLISKGYVLTNQSRASEIADLMHETTLAGVDPSLTTPEEKAKPGYAELRKRFTALPPMAKELYTTVRDAYRAQADETDALLLDNVRKAQQIALNRAEAAYKAKVDDIRNSEMEEPARRRALEDAESKYKADSTKAKWAAKARMTKLRLSFENSRVEAPYFPLARFGRYFVTAKDIDGKVLHFSRHEKAIDQRQAIDGLKRALPNAKIESGVLEESGDLRRAMDPRVVAEIETLLGDAGVDDTIRDALWQRFLETMPDLSMRKNFIHRKGTAGYNRDAFRVFASNQFHAAHQMARLKYGLELQELVNDAADQAKAIENNNKEMTLVNEFINRDKWVRNPTGASFTNWVTSAAFVWYLAASPASAMVNATQTVMLGIPMLGAKFGTAKSSAALMRAAKDFFVGRADLTRAQLTSDEQAAMHAFYDSGLIDRTQSHDLAAIGETGTKYNPVRSKVMNAMSWAFHNIEVFNRSITALAAYRLAREAGQAHLQAINTAHERTYATHFDMSNSSRPAVLQGDFAKAALVFRSYQINMLYRLARDLHQSIKGESAQVRKEARIQFAGVMGMMATMAGVTGVPGYGLAMVAAHIFQSIFGDDDDDPVDIEDRFKDGIKQILGPELGDVVLSGAPGHYLGIDLTSRIGMPDLWFRSPNKDLQGREEWQYYVLNSLGASVSMIGDMFEGFHVATDEKNVARGIETAAPKFVRDMMKSWRYAWEGVTSKNGDEVMSRDELSPYDLAAQFLGFTPSKIADRYDENNALKTAEKNVQDRRQSIVNDFARAVISGDDADRKAALQRVKTFNSNPLNASMAITGKSLKQALTTRAKNKAERVNGVLIQNKKLGAQLRNELQGSSDDSAEE